MTKKRAGINSNVYELYNFQTSRLEFFDGVSKWQNHELVNHKTVDRKLLDESI